MLILGRRTNQSIVFPNCGITVRLLEIYGRVAKVGIEAPRHVEVLRGELALSKAAIGSATFPHPDVVRYELNDAPESGLPVLQFAQRLADIQTSAREFQQLRSAGSEAQADHMLTELLHGIASLDRDWLQGVVESVTKGRSDDLQRISEQVPLYAMDGIACPIQILIVNEPHDTRVVSLPAGAFHGCQVSTINSHRIAQRAIETSEPFDYIVCNGGASAFDELEMVRTIRADRRLDVTKVLLTSNTMQSALEQIELSNTYRIDGWLARPLTTYDLWNHIVESEQIEA